MFEMKWVTLTSDCLVISPMKGRSMSDEFNGYKKSLETPRSRKQSLFLLNCQFVTETDKMPSGWFGYSIIFGEKTYNFGSENDQKYIDRWIDKIQQQIAFNSSQVSNLGKSSGSYANLLQSIKSFSFTGERAVSFVRKGSFVRKSSSLFASASSSIPEVKIVFGCKSVKSFLEKFPDYWVAITLGEDKFLVPKLLETSFHAIGQNLDVDGIFRLSGASSSVELLKSIFEKKENPGSSHLKDIHAVAGVVKMFFRDMVEPVGTFEHYKNWMNIVDAPSNMQVGEVKACFSVLPQENRNVMKYLLFFLLQVTKHSSTNRMTASNVGVVFGPNLFREETENLKSVLQTQSKLNFVVQILIENLLDIFPELRLADMEENEDFEHEVVPPPPE